MANKIALTGIKPSGTPHIGNYLGMIRPALDLARDYQALYFIADYHALTTVKDGAAMKRLSYEVAATWLALGLDPQKVIFFRQSDIPEIPEFTWILACFTAKGLLNRAHAYKALVDENVAAGNPPDDGINAGLYFYPVLMAADILLYGSHVVPVGADQKQHIEITRDIAQAFNNTYGNILVVPEAAIREEVMTIPGLDGRKMSKSYDNVIPIFVQTKDLRKSVMRIVTDSRRPEEPKDPDQDNVFAIYRYFAEQDDIERTRQRYLAGGLAYSEIKNELFELLEGRFGAARQKYEELIQDPGYLDQVLKQGAEKARSIAAPILERTRRAVGVRGL
jgi:tryptophanyl-tRNA synthetase